jgi:hypothetical protein
MSNITAGFDSAQLLFVTKAETEISVETETSYSNPRIYVMGAVYITVTADSCNNAVHFTYIYFTYNMQ